MKNIYVAGLFDGEGSCSVRSEVRNGRITYYVRVSLGSTDKNIIYKMHKKYGGSIRIVKYDNPNWNDRYDWITGAKNGYLVINKIVKYLIIKRVLVELVIEFHNKCIVDKNLNIPRKLRILEQKKYYDLSRELNKRGKLWK